MSNVSLSVGKVGEVKSPDQVAEGAVEVAKGKKRVRFSDDVKVRFIPRKQPVKVEWLEVKSEDFVKDRGLYIDEATKEGKKISLLIHPSDYKDVNERLKDISVIIPEMNDDEKLLVKRYVIDYTQPRRLPGRGRNREIMIAELRKFIDEIYSRLPYAKGVDRKREEAMLDVKLKRVVDTYLDGGPFHYASYTKKFFCLFIHRSTFMDWMEGREESLNALSRIWEGNLKLITEYTVDLRMKEGSTETRQFKDYRKEQIEAADKKVQAVLKYATEVGCVW